ncbi:MAG: glycosyltransferase family 2 protein [Elusimicrobiales bacterium]
MKVSVLVPVYNEMRTLPALLERLSALQLDFEAVITDDGSTDGSAQWLVEVFREKRYPFISAVLLHSENMGKGAAVRTALSKAQGEIVVIQDADLEYDPAYIAQVVKPIESGAADVVYGSRLMQKGSDTYSLTYLLGNITLTAFINFLSGGNFTDAYTCHKAFKIWIIRKMRLESDGFEIEAEISMRAAFGGYRFMEVPILYKARSRAEGKKITGRDALKGVFTAIHVWRQHKTHSDMR